MSEEIKPVEFSMFLVLWNQRQNMKTPLLHIRIAQWLEERWNAGDKQLLLMAFRSAGKSTLVGIFAAWLIYRNTDLRILVLAADNVLAGKMVRNVKRIIERHPLTLSLKPKNADQWASDRFTVVRKSELRDPSMMARGVGSNITGSRADIVICDDVEVPNTCDSDEKRQDLRERLAEMNYVLTAGGTQLYVGTPHHYFSIYADVPRIEVDEERVFLDGFKRLCIPLLDEEGNSAWPEKYSAEIIEQIKTATGPNKFDSQMMLRAVNIMEGRLNPDLLEFYNAEVDYSSELQDLYIGHQKMVGVTCWWDPAFAAAKGDSSVVAVVYGDMGGDYYLHHVEYINIDTTPLAEEDEARQQCRVVAQIMKRMFLPSITIEMNGIGRFLPNIMKTILQEEKVIASVVGFNNTKAKEIRILEAFDAVMAAKRLHVNRSVCKTPFLMEMREWQPSRGRCKDDGLDAVAGALSLHPDRLQTVYKKGDGLQWTKNSRAYKAKGHYEI